jgi:sigma-B regulation protein RsbU (phosphoserine phosphatase)
MGLELSPEEISILEKRTEGWIAGLQMALCRTLIRSHAQEHPDDPELVLSQTNAHMLSDTDASRFVTVFFGVLSPEESVVHYCNAGHNPPILVHKARPDQPRYLEKTDVPLGILHDQEWECATVELAENDIILAYTDGVTEACDTNGDMFGTDQLTRVMIENLDRKASEIIATIFSTVDEHIQEPLAKDDMAVVVVKHITAR